MSFARFLALRPTFGGWDTPVMFFVLRMRVVNHFMLMCWKTQAYVRASTGIVMASLQGSMLHHRPNGGRNPGTGLEDWPDRHTRRPTGEDALAWELVDLS